MNFHEPFSYSNLVQRNIHYISEEVQDAIANMKILIAGCGMGSSFAIMAARMGCRNFILVDGDDVSSTNLNRQFYVQNDVRTKKVTALAEHIRAINPKACIEEIGDYLTKDNISGIVAKGDFIFDTVDFIDLVAIVELHDQCQIQKKPRITALNIGFDGGLIYFPSDSPYSFRRVFALPETGDISHLSYQVIYKKVIEKLAPHLGGDVLFAINKALSFMDNGIPCPASQIAPGAFMVASMAGNLLFQILSKREVQEAPYFILSHNQTLLKNGGIKMI